MLCAIPSSCLYHCFIFAGTNYISDLHTIGGWLGMNLSCCILLIAKYMVVARLCNISIQRFRQNPSILWSWTEIIFEICLSNYFLISQTTISIYLDTPQRLATLLLPDAFVHAYDLFRESAIEIAMQKYAEIMLRFVVHGLSFDLFPESLFHIHVSGFNQPSRK